MIESQAFFEVGERNVVKGTKGMLIAINNGNIEIM